MRSSQSRYIDNMIVYMEMDAGSKLSDTRKQALRKGLCFGFSVVHSYMNATGKLAWWKSALEKLAAWDGTVASLQQAANLPDADNPNETLNSIFKRMTNYVLYNFAHPVVSDIKEIGKQTDFLMPSLGKDALHFDSMKGAIKKSVAIAGYLSDDILRDMLIPEIFNQEAIYIIQGSGHACTIRYDRYEEKWYFYDPNYTSGEQGFTDQTTLIAEMHRILGDSLAIQMASWDSNILLTPFNQFSDALNKGKIPELLNSGGLHMIAVFTPGQLTALLNLAETNSATNAALSAALSLQQNNKMTGLHVIARYATEQLPKLLSLAGRDSTIAAALASALLLQDNNRWTGLHAIAQHASDQLPALFALAKTNIDIKNALIKASALQNQDGESALNIIADHEQGQTWLAEFFIAIKTENTTAASQKSTTVAQLKNCIHLYEQIHTIKLFNLPSAELEAIKILIANKADNVSINYDTVKEAVMDASSKFWGCRHSIDLLKNPGSHPEDKTRVGFVMRSIGLCFAESVETLTP